MWLTIVIKQQLLHATIDIAHLFCYNIFTIGIWVRKALPGVTAMIKYKTFWHRDTPKPDIKLKALRCDLCRNPMAHMTANQTAKLLQLPKTGIPKDVHGLVITCSYCGSMYIVTGITDPVNRAEV